MLFHRIPSSYPVVKIFQNSLPFNPTKVCLLLLVWQLALIFFHYPHHIFLAQSCCHLAPLEPSFHLKQADVLVFPLFLPMGELSDWFKIFQYKIALILFIECETNLKVCLVLAESFAIDNPRLSILFTD